MRTEKRKWLFSGLLTALFVFLASAALAADPVLRLHWTVEGQDVYISPVDRSGQPCFFLPGACRGQDPTVEVVQPGPELIWDGKAYPNGSVLPLESYLGQEPAVAYSDGRRLGAARVMQGSPIPSLFFEISRDDLNRVESRAGLDIKGQVNMVMLRGDGTLNAAETVPSFKTHGNSTFFAPKKAYVFKMEHKQDLAGMGRNKKWVLLANWFDISLIRNQITFDLCREVGLKGTPDCRQAELYLNGSYNGTYLLTEKIQLKTDRLEITDMEESLEKMNGQAFYDGAVRKKEKYEGLTLRYFDVAEPEDVTGGFLLELEKELQYSRDRKSAGFATHGVLCVTVKEPTHAGKRAMRYIGWLMNDFHNAVMDPEGLCRRTGKYYADFIDMESFALKTAVEEFTCNFDFRAGSQFLYKDSDRIDSRLYAGPGWDYDLTYGNKDNGVRNPAREDYVFTRSTDKSNLYRLLLTHGDFRQAARKAYEEIFLPAAEVLQGRRKAPEGSPLKSVPAYQAEIEASAEMNFTRWSARAVPDITNASGRTFQDAGTFVMNWVNVRLQTMTDTWLKEKSE